MLVVQCFAFAHLEWLLFALVGDQHEFGGEARMRKRMIATDQIYELEIDLSDVGRMHQMREIDIVIDVAKALQLYSTEAMRSIATENW